MYNEQPPRLTNKNTMLYAQAHDSCFIHTKVILFEHQFILPFIGRNKFEPLHCNEKQGGLFMCIDQCDVLFVEFDFLPQYFQWTELKPLMHFLMDLKLMFAKSFTFKLFIMFIELMKLWILQRAKESIVCEASELI